MYVDILQDYQLFFEGNRSITTNTPEAVFEAVINAIEHGSDYGARGPVQVRFKGGTHAAVIEVDDPGNGEIKLPLTVEEIIKKQESAGIRLSEVAHTYRDLLTLHPTSDSTSLPMMRGMGSIILTLSKAHINTEHLPNGGYRVVLLYDPRALPEWWLPQA